jgi:hypothetical protein
MMKIDIWSPQSNPDSKQGLHHGGAIFWGPSSTSRVFTASSRRHHSPEPSAPPRMSASITVLV